MDVYFIAVTASQLYNLNCNEAVIYAVHGCEV